MTGRKAPRATPEGLLRFFLFPALSGLVGLAAVACSRESVPETRADDSAGPADAPGAPVETAAATRETPRETGPAGGGAKAEAGPRAFDHARWASLLRDHVSEEGWVDYEALRAGRPAEELAAYLRELASARLEGLGKEERMAFWLNAYNAVCVKTLIDLDLPRKVPHAAFLGTNIFDDERYEVAGKVRSLDDIEHGILREEYDDHRIHAAVVCGASSCPRLRREPYTGKELDTQLDEECRRWIREGRTKKGERKNYLDRDRRTYYASKIFDWYEEDFGGSDEGVLRFVKRYASDGDREFLEKNRVRLRHLDYDWSLNSRAKPEGSG